MSISGHHRGRTLFSNGVYDMNKTVNSGVSENGQAALDRVRAVLEAVTGKPVNFVPIDGQDTDVGDDGGDDLYEAQMRPVLKPHMLAVINALEAAKASCQKVLGDAVGGLTVEQIDEQDLTYFVWAAEHEIGWLETLIQEFNFAADGGMMGLEVFRGSAMLAKQAEQKRR